MYTKKLATVLALGALALAPMAQSSQAASHLVGAVPSVGRAAAPPIIQGVVTDQFGHAVDDVDVHAVRANGNDAASALTYASAWADGPQHGYFYLEVGGKGSFTLTLSKDGYVTEEVGPFDVTRKRQRLSLGELELVKKLATKTTGELDDSSITPAQKGKVDVTVSGKGVSKPSGDIEIRDGGKLVGSGEMAAKDRGEITVTLKRLPGGKYVLKAYYLGAESLKPSSSSSFTLTVKKPRHRPNAW